VRADPPDVFFASAYTAPLALGVPLAVAIHDVSFAAHPEWFSWREGTRRRVLTRQSAARAAKVVTVSDFSKREIVRLLGIPSSKVEVIYSGVTGWSGGAAAAPREPVVLYVGSLFTRRHIPELIAAFGLVARRHAGVRLEIVGDNRTRPPIDVNHLITASGVADRIRARSYVSDSELAALYGQASAFALFSDYEGFAMTPLDALGAGIPVALLDTEVAREIYGPAALYVPRAEPELIAAAIERLLHDEAERRRLLAAAAVQLERYSWQECAQRTLQVLLAAARR
jgi:glycosyltransferase involved in cell wall biosynthesis